MSNESTQITTPAAAAINSDTKTFAQLHRSYVEAVALAEAALNSHEAYEAYEGDGDDWSDESERRGCLSNDADEAVRAAWHRLNDFPVEVGNVVPPPPPGLLPSGLPIPSADQAAAAVTTALPSPWILLAPFAVPIATLVHIALNT